MFFFLKTLSDIREGRVRERGEKRGRREKYPHLVKTRPTILRHFYISVNVELHVCVCLAFDSLAVIALYSLKSTHTHRADKQRTHT